MGGALSAPFAPVEPQPEEDDFQEALIRKSQRETQLAWNYGLLSASVVGSWMLGQSGFSIAWIALLLGFLFIIWHGRFTRLVEETLVFEKLRVHRRRALQNEETAEWLNFLLNRWWTFSSQTIFTFLKASLDPLLNDSKPNFLDSIELSEFTLGDGTPIINSVKAFDITSGTRNPVTSGTIGKSLFLPESHKGQIALEVDMGLHCPDYRMILHSRLGGRGVGVDLDIAMEKLNISGKLSIIFNMSLDCSFPHIPKMTFSFIEKPEVWFNLRILKAVQMMEVPFLKQWVHSIVMDALTTALVDPGKLDLNLSASEGLIPDCQSANSLAQGVLTVTLSRSQQQSYKPPAVGGDEERWCVVRLGQQRQVTSKMLASRWQECRSFLVENPNADKVSIKVKSKRLISTINLAQFEVPLSNFSFDGNKVVETVLQKKNPKSSVNAPTLNLRMEYTPLTPVALDGTDPAILETNLRNIDIQTPAGVLYICVHGAEGLITPDKTKMPNPYCIIFCNRKKIKTTHYVCHSTNPKWESCIELLVADYLQTVISFAICSWDVNKMMDSDLLGLGSVVMTKEENFMQRRQIPLTFNVSTVNCDDKNFGIITVTAIFRPVSSVAESDHAQLYSPVGNSPEEDEGRPIKFKRSSTSNFMQTAKMLLTNTKDQESPASVDFGDILSSGSGLMELTVLRARDLVAKDLNGFSDPYCEVKLNQECKFKTSCKKKTLNPVWEESVTLQLPKNNEILFVILWDRDPLGMKDFLGSISMTLDEIRQHSSKEIAEWFALKDTETGEVELKIKVISEDIESQESDLGKLVESGQTMGSPTTLAFALPLFESTSNKVQKSGSPICRKKLPLAVPIPIPPRKEELPKPMDNAAISPIEDSASKTMATTNPPTLEVTDCPNLRLSTKNPSFDESSLNSQLSLPSESSESSKSPTAKHSNHKSGGIRATPEYSSIRSMKQKVKHGLTHPLRRFRSEANVHEGKAKALQDRVTVEPRDPSESLNNFDSLVQAKSQPDISTLVPVSIDINATEKKMRFFNIQGKVIQGLGFKAHQCLIYCRIRLIRTYDKRSKSVSGKTVCKSSMVPASINPHFDAEFQIDNSSGILKSAALTVDIRTDKKETVACKTLTLQELFGDSEEDSAEIQDWFTLSNGAKIELEISHGKSIDKKPSSAMKLFRSWSVHRIGKV